MFPFSPENEETPADRATRRRYFWCNVGYVVSMIALAVAFIAAKRFFYSLF